MQRSGRSYYRISKMIVAWAVFLQFGASQTPAGDFDLYLALEDYQWQEFVHGSRLLEESGFLYGLGFVYSTELDDHLTLRPAAEIFGGTVDYEGQTVTRLAASTDTNYFGVKVECDLGRRYRSGRNLVIEPFGGLGLRAWTRDLEDTTLSDGTPASGYPEDWVSLYGRLGLRGSGELSAQKRFFAQAGVKAPLYNRMTAYQSEIGGQDLTFHPGKQPSFFAEAGVRTERFTGSIFYEGIRFEQSESIITIEGLEEFENFQPESRADLYGVKLGVAF